MRSPSISDAQPLWEPTGAYCNTASYGLPPRPAWEALQTALAQWRGGSTSWEHWGESTESARASFARLLGVPAEWVAVGATVSELVGSLVTALPDGARVVVPEVEFTSTRDATRAAGRLPFAGERFDAVVVSAYKWLMSPRGTAFAAVAPRLLERVVRHRAGWYAGADVHASYFGPPLRPPPMRRLDQSPAWFS